MRQGEHCTCVTEDKCVANSPAYVPCEACGADGDPDLKELPQPNNPDAMKGCFNAFSGQCTGCGRPSRCPDYNNADLTDPMGFPYFYTGTSAFCSHCPDSQGCWDGDFAGGPEHCTCVTDPTPSACPTRRASPSAAASWSRAYRPSAGLYDAHIYRVADAFALRCSRGPSRQGD